MLILMLCILAAIPQPAAAYYDDVHYGLNYLIARVIGYTPEQAYRLSSACVSVDWSEDTEPTQLGHACEAGVSLFLRTVAYSGEKGVNWLLNALETQDFTGKPDFDDKLVDFDLKRVAAPQWKFHAFRNSFLIKGAYADGPGAAEADALILKQREGLWQFGLQDKNPGVFLHYDQDMIPHGKYTVIGGHWFCPTAVMNKLPMGSTTDWLAFRPIESNEALVYNTAERLITFMNQVGKGKQKPVVQNADEVVAALRPALIEIRAKQGGNAPFTLLSLEELIQVYSTMGNEAEVKKLPENLQRHANGPSTKAAYDAVDAHLKKMGFADILRHDHEILQLISPFDDPKANFAEPNKASLYGSLRVNVVWQSKPNQPFPKKIEVSVWAEPTRDGVKPYLLDRSMTTAPGDSLLGEGVPLDFHDVPMGTVKVEVSFDGTLRATKRVEIGKLQEIDTIAIKEGESIYQGMPMDLYYREPGTVRGTKKQGMYTTLDAMAELSVTTNGTVKGEVREKTLYELDQFGVVGSSTTAKKFELKGKMVVPTAALMQPARGTYVLKGEFTGAEQFNDEGPENFKGVFVGILYNGKDLAIPGYPQFRENFLVLYKWAENWKVPPGQAAPGEDYILNPFYERLTGQRAFAGGILAVLALTQPDPNLLAAP